MSFILAMFALQTTLTEKISPLLFYCVKVKSNEYQTYFYTGHNNIPEALDRKFNCRKMFWLCDLKPTNSTAIPCIEVIQAAMQ